MDAISKNIWPALALIASVWGFFAFIQPEYAAVSMLRAEKKQYEEAISNALAVTHLRGERLAERDSVALEDWKRLDRLLPNKVDGVKLIMDVSGVATLYGIKLEGFKVDEIEQENSTPDYGVAGGLAPAPSAEGQQQSGASAYGASSVGVQEGAGEMIAPSPQAPSNVKKVKLTINFKSAYSNFVAFLKNLERSLQLFDVTAVALKGSSGKEAGTYLFDLELETYHIK